jgi:hypothetical protein
VHAHQRFGVARPEFVQVAAHAQDDFFRVEALAGIVGGAVLGAAAAFHTGEGLQRIDFRDVFAGVQAEILVTGKGRNPAETLPFQKNGNRTEDQV